jgi:ribosomal protein L7/L12
MDFREALVFLQTNMPHVSWTVDDLIRVSDALVLATGTPSTPEEWARNVFTPSVHRDRKILFIKDVRAAANCGLVDAKNAVETVLSEDALAQLREKLTTPSFPDPSDNVSWALDQDEDRAYAEHRERIAEQGTWFGAPGPLDEEPF